MNISEWQTEIRNRFSTLFCNANAELPNTAYGLVSAVALAPLVSAVAAGDMMGAFGALNTVLVGVSGNLIANQFQQWVDMRNAASSDEAFTAQLANDLQQQARDDSKLRDALDEINTKLEALQQLPEPTADSADWQAPLLQTLRAELTQLGNAKRYTEALIKIENSGSGAVATNGGIAGGAQSVVGKEVYANTIITGGTHYHQAPESPTDTNPKSLIHNSLFSDYLHALRTECDALPLAAMGGETGAGRELCLGDVYIDLNTTQRRKMTDEEIAAGKKKAEEDKSRFDEEQEVIINAQEAADKYSQLLLLGDPGSGKSTFVRQLAAKQATHLLNANGQQPTTTSPQPHLPIFVILHELIPGLDALHQNADFQKSRTREQEEALTTLLVEEWNRWLADKRIDGLEVDLERWARGTQIASNNIMLVLDGLDEVPEQLRPLLYQMIDAIKTTFLGIERIIVTCRVRSYFQGMLPGFESFTLADFTNEQISKFVTAWYRTQQVLGRMDQRRADQQIADLQQAANGNLRELAQNPMLLTTMTIVHQKETKLPDQRVELYDLAVDVLMNRWQQNKDQVTALSPQLDELLADSRRLRRILERLAYEAHKAQASRGENDGGNEQESENENDSPQQPLRRGELLVLLENLLNDDTTLANEFLDYIDHRAGLLVGRGGTSQGTNRKPPTYTFPHRTFQEYLAGCHMNHGREYIRTYDKHAREGDFWRVAALYGAEELYYNNKNETAVLDLAYALCPSKGPRTQDEWRSVVWSGQMAALLGSSVINADDQSDGSKSYLKRLLSRLAKLAESSQLSPLERAEAGTALGKLGDPRPGVGLKNSLPHIDWIPIDAGPFTMGSEPEKDKMGYNWEQPQFTCNVITQPYHISRYPITVAQYRPFVDAGGYQERSFWTEAGWAWREEQEVSGPQTYAAVYQTPNHPQVGVSWYEAIAYCRWLSHELGIKIMLPNEAQWERAARHIDGRIFPWGDEFEPTHCNMGNSGIGRTSAVGFFPKGNAVCGAADMSGNVIEWTSTQ